MLKIIDDLRGCYRGGPQPLSRFLWNPNRVWMATDAVDADAVAWEFLHDKQVELGMRKAGGLRDLQNRHDFLTRAENLDLGVFRSRKIERKFVELPNGAES